MPESGGEYTYLLHGIHSVVSYLYCYMTAIVMKPAPVAILGKVKNSSKPKSQSKLKSLKSRYTLRKSIPSGKKGIVLMESIYSFVWVRGCDVT